MNEKKNESNYKSVWHCIIIAILLSLILGLAFRPLVSRAASPDDATLTDANDRLDEFREAAQNARSGSNVATNTDVDKTPYLTNDSLVLQTDDLLLSIRNLLVCIWLTIFLLWGYDKLKAVILRLGGFRNDK